MAASPLYSLRTQRALDFGNGDVPTIFKNIQLDIGAPHQFMDFRYKVDDPKHGEFWLDHCGALMDVEPMGEEFVHGMCHDIEDPTFDATAGATNPYAQVRPIHRPPRVPADRAPHCHWRVVIDHRRRAGRAASDDGDRRRVGDRADRDRRSRRRRRTRRLVRLLRRVRSRLHARRPVAPRAAWSRCKRSRCRRTCSRTRTCTASRAAGASTKRSRTRRRCSPAPPAWRAGRLPAVLGITGDDAEAIAKLLQLHPVFQPRTYVAPTIDVIDERPFASRCATRRASTSTTASRGSRPWRPSRRRRSTRSPGRSIPRASSAPDAPRAGEHLAWRITIDPAAEPARPSPSVELARISTGATVTFLPRRDLRT